MAPQMSPAWSLWIQAVWPQVMAHKPLPVPPELEHPGEAGFRPALVAEPIGQIGDWVAPIPGHPGRVHVHEFADGQLWAHVDAVDPGRGPVAALRHVAGETVSGRWIFSRAVGALVGVAWGRVAGR